MTTCVYAHTRMCMCIHFTTRGKKTLLSTLLFFFFFFSQCSYRVIYVKAGFHKNCASMYYPYGHEDHERGKRIREKGG